MDFEKDEVFWTLCDVGTNRPIPLHKYIYNKRDSFVYDRE